MNFLIKKHLNKIKPISVLIVGSFVIAIIACIYFYKQNLILVYVDSQSHLNFARLFFDSITPGISQIGFWPPLLHILLAIPAQIKWLYTTGLSGAVVLIPVLVLGVYFMYRLVYLVTQKVSLGVIASVILVCNPFILYYSSVPMMEVLFFTSTIGMLYFIAKWLISDQLYYLLIASLFVSITCVSRFEGFIFIPAISLIILVVYLIKKESYSKIEATLVITAPLFIFGLATVLVYGYIYANNPIEFLNGRWSAFAQQQFLFLPTKDNFILTITYFANSAKFMIGGGLLIISLLSLIFLLNKKRTMLYFTLLSISLLPILFIIFSLYRGNTVIYLNNLPPYTGFFNDRYGLQLLIPVILAVSFIGGQYIQTKNNKVNKLQKIVTLGIPFFALLYSLIFSYNTFFVDKFSVIKIGTKDIESFTLEQKKVAEKLCLENKPGEYTLFTRALLNAIPINSCIKSSSIILESNYPYYDQAIERPWLYATYVVLQDNSNTGSYELSTDQVTKLWGGDNKLFNIFYDPILKTERLTLYKVDIENVKLYAKYINTNDDLVYTIQSVKRRLNINYYKQLGYTGASELLKYDQDFLDFIKNKKR